MEGQQVLQGFQSGGKKFDKQKTRLDLISPIALEEEGKVMTFGASKYGDNNWREGIAWSRVIGALLRHANAFNGGEDNDPETGISHLAHVRCCAAFILEYLSTHKELDDRVILKKSK